MLLLSPLLSLPFLLLPQAPPPLFPYPPPSPLCTLCSTFNCRLLPPPPQLVQPPENFLISHSYLLNNLRRVSNSATSTGGRRKRKKRRKKTENFSQLFEKKKSPTQAENLSACNQISETFLSFFFFGKMFLIALAFSTLGQSDWTFLDAKVEDRYVLLQLQILQTLVRVCVFDFV